MIRRSRIMSPKAVESGDMNGLSADQVPMQNREDS